MSTPRRNEAVEPVQAESPHTPEANTLAQRARQGDRGALEELLASARPRALAVALRVLKDRDEAEDAVQDAFMKVCRHLDRFEGRSAFSTWMHRIVVNTSLDRLRQVEGRGEQTGLADGTGAGDADEARRSPQAVDPETPEQRLDRAETRATVRRALRRLTPVHEQALTLREFEDHSYDEIARAVRCPVGTIMSRLHHARRRLAEELSALAPAAEAA